MLKDLLAAKILVFLFTFLLAPSRLPSQLPVLSKSFKQSTFPDRYWKQALIKYMATLKNKK
jgi:hypothetical protein